MKINKILSAVFGAALLFTVSCNDDPIIEIPKGAYEDGILITNEGNMGASNASVSFVSNDLGTVEQNIYKTNNNNEDLGDVLQAVGYYQNYAFLVLNNSNKIKIVDRYSFKKVNEITNQINQPRYITFNGNYLYVTNDEYMGPKYVSVYNILDLSFVKKIDMTETTERIVSVGNNVFVQHSSYGYGNKISYINGSSATVQSEITVPNGQIQNIISDNSNLYAITSDASSADSYIYQYSSTGALVKTTTLTGIANAANLNLDNGKFYFNSGMKIYSMDVNSSTVPATLLVTATESSAYSGLYGFKVIDGKIFTSDANGFTADSKITVYSSTGSVLKTFDGGRITNGFYKN